MSGFLVCEHRGFKNLKLFVSQRGKRDNGARVPCRNKTRRHSDQHQHGSSHGASPHIGWRQTKQLDDT